MGGFVYRYLEYSDGIGWADYIYLFITVRGIGIDGDGLIKILQQVSFHIKYIHYDPVSTKEI